MISLNLNAARAMADFWKGPGGTFQELPPARTKPRHARRDWVDPETVLKRRRRPVSAADRKAFSKMSSSI